MTVIDDITALLTPVLHTNTTKDITAAAVRAALISAFTDIVADVDAKEAATLAAQIQPSKIAQAAESVKSSGLMLVDGRLAQQRPGVPPAPVVGSDYRFVYNMDAMGGITPHSKVNFDGTLDTTAGFGWATSDYFAVPPGGTITAIRMRPEGVAFYDINKTYISSVYPAGTGGVGAGLTTPQAITVPSTAVYGRVSFSYYGDNNNTIDAFQILAGDWTANGLPFHPWQTMVARPSMFRPWMGRVWSSHGDGWWDPTVGNDWFTRVGQYHGVATTKVEAHANGRASTLLAGFNTTGTLLPLSFWDDVDACFVNCGLKDATAPSYSLGTISDATSATTFYGYYRNFIETVLTRNPFMRMILAVPHDVTGTSSATVDPYRQAVRDLGNYYSLKLLDIKAEGQFSPVTFTAYSHAGDGSHPGFHQGGLNTSSPPIKEDWGANIVYGGPLKGLMHTVFPVDHWGDPVSNDNVNPISVV